jgi:hypothetical protein
MASKPLEFHPEAEQEYLTALAWYRERSMVAAINFASEFERATARIREAPQRWPLYFADCKRYILHQFPFSIVYRTFPSQTVVLAVAHGHRRPGYWKSRVGWQAPTSS